MHRVPERFQKENPFAMVVGGGKIKARRNVDCIFQAVKFKANLKISFLKASFKGKF